MSGNKIVAEYKDSQITIINERKAPIALLHGKSFQDWVSERAMDGSRSNAHRLKIAHGLNSFASDYDTAMTYHAATITDNFWCKRQDEAIEYADIIFKDDRYFSMAVTQEDTLPEEKRSPTPELTNIGCQEKGWKKEADGWWLYKKEKEHEMLFEAAVCSIGRALGFDMATYELKDGYIRTKDFTGQRYNLQHADSIMKEHTEAGKTVSDEDWLYNYREFLNISGAVAKSYLNILFLDAICNNVDRHTKNYGLLTDRNTGELIGLAPNYDNNMAFYGFDKGKSGHRLAKDFADFIRTNDIPYIVPEITEAQIKKALNGLRFPEQLSKAKIAAYVMENIGIISQ